MSYSPVKSRRKTAAVYTAPSSRSTACGWRRLAVRSVRNDKVESQTLMTSRRNTKLYLCVTLRRLGPVHERRGLMRRAFGVAFAMVLSGGCGGDSGAPCASDADCKGDRICVQGACVDVGAEAGASSDGGGVDAAAMDAALADAAGVANRDSGDHVGDSGMGEAGVANRDSGDHVSDSGMGEAGADASADATMTDAAKADAEAGSPPECGNGTQEPGESCDDGYTDACGTCNADCTGPGSGTDCGDSTICPETEACDDGASNSYTYGNPKHCDPTCQAFAPYCGDGNVTGFEFCDDGIFNGDSYGLNRKCNTACSGYAPYCGDRVANGSEACDTGATNSDSYAAEKHCNGDCSAFASYCGDTVTDAPETCDDGISNGLPGSCNSGCSGTCVPGDPGCFYPVGGVLPCLGGVETWTAAKKYYGITADVLVPVGCTLTIEPGVIVRAWDNHYLQIDGGLVAIGTPADPITFEDTSVRLNVDVSLDYILLQGSQVLASADLSVSNSEFVNSSIRWTAGTVMDRSLAIVGSSFDCVAVPYVGAADPVAIRISLENGDGVLIEDSTIANCGTGVSLSAVFTSGGTAQIRRNTITACTVGVRLGSFSGGPATTTIEDNIIQGNGGGIECGGEGTECGSRLVIRYNSLSNNNGSRRVGAGPGASSGVSYGALFLAGIGNAQVTHNEISGNRTVADTAQVAGVYVTGSGLTFSNNNLVGADPAAYVFYPNATPDINAQSNYWGDVVTQEMVNEGVDSDISVIYDYHDHFSRPRVDYSNWLSAPEPTAGPR